MFTYVKLKNFLSFRDITFDFKRSGSNVKDFVAIYGENGSGKSNFVQSFDFLWHTLTSFDNDKWFEKLSNILKDNKDGYPNEILQHFLLSSDYLHYISQFHMIDCNEPTEVEYGFLLNGKEGIYKLSFDERFRQESLYYLTGKQRGYLFTINVNDEGAISFQFYSKLFRNEKVREEMIDEILKYWGKHTFLAILFKNIHEKNENYIKENFSEYVLSVIDMLEDISIINKKTNRSVSQIVSIKNSSLLPELRNGIISKSDLSLLKKTEMILSSFFTQSYADIKNVRYETEKTEEDKIKYQLYMDKMIAGKVRTISIENESAGTQQVLNIVRTILGLFCGVTVIYDEIDNGIHDILLSQIIHSLKGKITGQFIITTHNTLLMEEMDPHSAYVIQVDYKGDKEVHCVADYAVQNNNNIRVKYLKGAFGGTPYVDGIDYGEIMQELKEEK